MAESGWLELNAQRPYPFVPTADCTTPGGVMPRNEALADAGFTLGPASAFEIGRDHVYLHAIYVSPALLRFFFRLKYGAAATYEAASCYEWVFEFAATDLLGTTKYATATRIVDDPLGLGVAKPEMGIGFVALGLFSVVQAALPTGLHELTLSPELEPALLQSAVDTFVNTLRLANEGRPCPSDCPCPPAPSSSSSSSLSSSSSSSPSSSSSSSPAPSSSSSSSSSAAGCQDPLEPEPEAASAPIRLPLPGGSLTGDVKLKPGYNCQIAVEQAGNRIIVRAKQAHGAGMQCEDLRIGTDGVPVHDSCLPCGGLVFAINGHGYAEEYLQLIGGPGVVVVADPDNHRIVVGLEEDGLCKVEI